MPAISVIIGLLVFSFFGTITARGQMSTRDADTAVSAAPCIEWRIKSNEPVNKRQAERLYDEACRWVEEKFAPMKGHRRPCMVVSVGAPCPDARIKGPCANPIIGELYIPEWQQTSPATVAQGTISTMLLHLFDAKEITRAVEGFLSEDSRGFLDLMAKGGKKSGKK